MIILARMLNDKVLIDAIKSGEQTAFKMLYDTYANMVYNASLNILQQPADAEDITQEIFIEIYHSINKFKQESSLKTWIYKITVNKCYDGLKKQKAQKRWAKITSLFGDDNKLNFDQAHFEHPGVSLENKEHLHALFKAISKLPLSQQTAFTLCKIEGLSYQEIAAIMNTSISGVESLLFRANRNLRNRLSDYYKNNLEGSASLPAFFLLMF